MVNQLTFTKAFGSLEKHQKPDLRHI